MTDRKAAAAVLLLHQQFDLGCYTARPRHSNREQIPSVSDDRHSMLMTTVRQVAQVIDVAYVASPMCPRCDGATASRCDQLEPQAERDAISAELEALRADQPEAVRSGLEAALLAGVAAHHAGCLPAWKSLIERCFQRGAAMGHAPCVLGHASRGGSASS